MAQWQSADMADSVLAQKSSGWLASAGEENQWRVWRMA